MFTNKEQLCQSFWQSVKEQELKAKKIPPPLKASRVNHRNLYGIRLILPIRADFYRLIQIILWISVMSVHIPAHLCIIQCLSLKLLLLTFTQNWRCLNVFLEVVFWVWLFFRYIKAVSSFDKLGINVRNLAEKVWWRDLISVSPEKYTDVLHVWASIATGFRSRYSLVHTKYI